MLSNQPWLAAIRVRPAFLNEALVDKAHALGLSVFVRATRDGEDTLGLLDRVAASGADVITLDNLDVFRQWKASTNPAVDQPE
jgi:glycerophosphoryl diester phosphodiesterase